MQHDTAQEALLFKHGQFETLYASNAYGLSSCGKRGISAHLGPWAALCALPPRILPFSKEECTKNH